MLDVTNTLNPNTLTVQKVLETTQSPIKFKFRETNFESPYIYHIIYRRLALCIDFISNFPIKIAEIIIIRNLFG